MNAARKHARIDTKVMAHQSYYAFVRGQARCGRRYGGPYVSGTYELGLVRGYYSARAGRGRR